MSKVKEIWYDTIGSVHGADVNQELCFKAAVQLAAYASELEKEQSDLDWLEDALVELNNENTKRRATEYSERGLAWFNAKSSAYDEILDLIKARKEAKS